MTSRHVKAVIELGREEVFGRNETAMRIRGRQHGVESHRWGSRAPKQHERVLLLGGATTQLCVCARPRGKGKDRRRWDKEREGLRDRETLQQTCSGCVQRSNPTDGHESPLVRAAARADADKNNTRLNGSNAEIKLQNERCATREAGPRRHVG